MGIRECLRYGHGSVFILSFLGYMVVGLGSMAFHATLKCMWLAAFISVTSKHMKTIGKGCSLDDQIQRIITWGTVGLTMINRLYATG